MNEVEQIVYIGHSEMSINLGSNSDFILNNYFRELNHLDSDMRRFLNE